MASVSVDTGDDAASSGTGLKLPSGLVQGTAQAADVPAALAAQPATPVVADKSLVTVKRNTAGKPRLGPQLDAGLASWYGSRFQGRRTASGEKFDRYALTAAHKTLPFGSRVVVSNPRTGKQIVVRINDRGPYIGNRVLDLSEAAAHALGLKASGHDWVVMNAVLPPAEVPDAAAYAVTLASAPDAQANQIPAQPSALSTAARTATPVTAAPLAAAETAPAPANTASAVAVAPQSNTAEHAAGTTAPAETEETAAAPRTAPAASAAAPSAAASEAVAESSD